MANESKKGLGFLEHELVRLFQRLPDWCDDQPTIEAARRLLELNERAKREDLLLFRRADVDHAFNHLCVHTPFETTEQGRRIDERLDSTDLVMGNG